MIAMIFIISDIKLCQDDRIWLILRGSQPDIWSTSPNGINGVEKGRNLIFPTARTKHYGADTDSNFDLADRRVRYWTGVIVTLRECEGAACNSEDLAVVFESCRW